MISLGTFGTLFEPLNCHYFYCPFLWAWINIHEWIQRGGQGIWIPWIIIKLPSQHSMLGHHRYASETPFKWRFAGGPMIACLYSIRRFSIEPCRNSPPWSIHKLALGAFTHGLETGVRSYPPPPTTASYIPLSPECRVIAPNWGLCHKF